MKKNKCFSIHNHKGFTLIETIIVIAIIAILAAIGIPTYSKMIPDMRLKSAAQDLYASLQEAKMNAVNTNSSSSIIFEPDSDRYTKANGTVINLEQKYEGSVSFEDFDGEESVTFTGDPPFVTFTARGMADKFGKVFFKNSKDNYYMIQVLQSGVIEIKKP